MRLRVSYTLLALWARGQYNEAIDTYLHNNTYTSEAIRQGSEIHKQIENEITKHNRLPEFLRVNVKFTAPEPEKEVSADYKSDFTLKGYFDAYDREQGLLLEFKTGRSPISAWARTKQIPMYLFMAKLAGLPVKRVLLIHYNQYEDRSEFMIIHPTRRLVRIGKKFVDGTAPDVLTYFDVYDVPRKE